MIIPQGIKMKLFNLVLILFLSACTVQGSVVLSRGVIDNWQHDGFYSEKNDIKILFSVENDDYQELDETLFGISIVDRKKSIKSALGKKPFIIKVNVQTTNESIYIKQNANLVLAGKEYSPVNLKKGIDRVASGRQTHNIKPSQYDEFMEIDNSLEGFDHNWLWLEFNVVTPNPTQEFILYLDIKNNFKEERIKANFSGKNMNIYHH